ncbi:MAG TPA: hypothetical protein VGQ03_08280 [Nitrososphaera sp.]|jgi:hypothetical protein|nr:hypothetical protein [Nitrososphaera sp.]
MTVIDTEQEMNFRERYAIELRKKKVNNSVSQHFGADELSDEIKKVARQEMATPGRRGEQIKREEISKEIVRRTSLQALLKSKGKE